MASADLNPIQKILVATDFSEMADFVLERAVAIAKQTDATIDLVHVREPFVYPLTAGFRPTETEEDDLVSHLNQELAVRVARVNDPRVRCMATLCHGNPARELVRYAERTGKDLIVMGTHGRGGFDHAVFGSVAERVVQKAPCPVLVIPRRPPGGQS